MTDRPNVLYLHSHDTGRYVQPYGYPVATPHLQRLAEEGVLFRQALAAAPTCSPSRAALLTGQCPHQNGMMGLTHRGWVLHDYRRHLVYTLRKAGYITALAGVQHEAPEPGGAERIGYNTCLKTEDHSAASVAEAAARFLAGPLTQPFFLSVGFVETHLLPGASSFGYSRGDPRYALPPPTLPDTPPTRQDMADFKVAVGALDEGIGTVLAALEQSGQAESTLVICTTDHGLPLPGLKGTLTDGGLGVMLILRGPGGFGGGQVVDSLVSQLDLFPTVCDLLKLSRPPWLEGRSLFPLVRGEAARLHEAVFAETTHHVAYEPLRSVRTERYRYVRRFGGRERPVLPNCDDSASKSFWLERGWRERRVPGEALFDLAFDPHEMANLALEPAAAGILSEMRGRLAKWMRETDDPLFNGPVGVPPGTLVKDPDGLSPSEPGTPV